MSKFVDVRDQIVAEILRGASEGVDLGSWDYLDVDNDADLAVSFYYTDTELNPTSRKLTAKQVNEITALVDTGLCRARANYIEHGIAYAGDIDELATILNRINAFKLDADINVELYDATRLPTFDGNEPNDTMGVFSWDETHLLRCDSTSISQYGGGPHSPWFTEPR